MRFINRLKHPSNIICLFCYAFKMSKKSLKSSNRCFYIQERPTSSSRLAKKTFPYISIFLIVSHGEDRTMADSTYIYINKTTIYTRDRRVSHKSPQHLAIEILCPKQLIKSSLGVDYKSVLLPTGPVYLFSKVNCWYQKDLKKNSKLSFQTKI